MAVPLPKAEVPESFPDGARLYSDVLANSFEEITTGVAFEGFLQFVRRSWIDCGDRRIAFPTQLTQSECFGLGIQESLQDSRNAESIEAFFDN
jgi:hypothetical protein